MNPNTKGVTIGIGSGLGAQVGAIVVYVIEQAAAIDMPTEIDQAVIGIVTAAVGYLTYRLLPAAA